MTHLKRSALIIVLVGLFSVVPVLGNAQTFTGEKGVSIDQLQAQLQSLLEQVRVLQAKLVVAQGGGSSGQSWCHTFNTNLHVGNRGDEISYLQQALESEGFTIADADKSREGQGTQANVIGDSTASAVTGFQEKYASGILTPNGLQHGTGYVGRATRAKLNQLYGCEGGVVPPPLQNGSLYIQPTNPSVQVGQTIQVQAFYQPPMSLCPSGISCIQVMPAPISISANWGSTANTITFGARGENGVSITGVTAGATVLSANYISPSGALLTATTNLTVTNGIVQPSITVLSPNGGEVWQTGSIQTIKWTYSGFVSKKMNVYLSRPGTGMANLLIAGMEERSTVQTSVQYQVPPSLSGPGYKILVCDDSAAICDSSDGYFTIVASTAQPSITVLSPNGGESFQIGGMYPVKWASNGLGKNIAINLIDFTPGPRFGMQYAIRDGSTAYADAASGQFMWTISPGIPAGSYYEVYIGDATPNVPSSGLTDGSDNYFTIVMGTTQSPLTVTAPNGGERWMLNSGVTDIKWSPDPESQYVQAYLEKYQNGQYVTVGKVIKAGKGSIQWLGEIDNYANYAQPGDGYYIRLVNTQTGATDRSNAPFTILPIDYMKVDLKINGSDDLITVSSGGGYATLSWTSTNADSCTFYPNDLGTVISGLPSSGTRVVFLKQNPYSYNYAVAMLCSSAVGQRSDYVQVMPAASPSVTPQVTSFTITNASDAFVNSTLGGLVMRFDWTVTNADGVSLITAASCPAGFTITNAYDNSPFYCGDIGRKLATSEPIYLRFVNKTPYSVNVPFFLTALSGGVGNSLSAKTVYAIVPSTLVSTGSLSFSQTSFNFNYVLGGSVPAFQSLTFNNTSNVNVNYTISVPNQPAWLNTGYATGVLTSNPNSPTGLGALANPAGLSSGMYTTNIIISGNFVGSPVTIPVTLIVSPPGVGEATPSNENLASVLSSMASILEQMKQVLSGYVQ